MRRYKDFFHDFMKSRVILFATLFLLCLMIIEPCSASIFLKDGTEIPNDKILETITKTSEAQSDTPFPIQFFYSSSCGSCHDAQEYLKSFERKNPGIPIEYHNLVSNAENRQLFNEYRKQFHNIDIPYPIIFLGNVGISGSSDIIHHTTTIADWYQKKSK